MSHSCSYCDSPLVDAQAAAVSIDRVAPFRISARAAEDRLREHLATRWWAPRPLRRAARDGRVKPTRVEGLLVPFCAYDASCRSRYETMVGIHWSKVETVVASGEPSRKVKRHTEWFPLAGTVVHQLRDYIVCASAGLTAPEVAALCPFDLGRARPFDSRVVAGWSAELPSRARVLVDHQAQTEIRFQELRRIGCKHLPGDIHRQTRISCHVELVDAELVLLPVWVMALRYGDTVHRLLVNGQTGRCVGSVPVSPHKVVLAILSVVILIAWLVWKGPG